MFNCLLNNTYTAAQITAEKNVHNILSYELLQKKNCSCRVLTADP